MTTTNARTAAPAGAAHKSLTLLDAAIETQRPLVARHIAALRRRKPSATPSEVVRGLEKAYIASLSASGAAIGGTAAAPGVGTSVAVALTAGETVVALEQGVLLALAIAEVHGISISDVERRRTLVMSVLLGRGGPAVMARASERIGKHWGRQIAQSVPLELIKELNKVLGRHFVTRYGTKQGIVVIGRLAPFGVGAAVGGAGNAAMAWGVVQGARRAFGAPPRAWSVPVYRRGSATPATSAFGFSAA
ncbi:hypothetical protein [Demequina pelophila]|uniref:hypothetical protein n=1 Tax=Demequina pelophila TaxID=1638984 RepID=UPI0007824D98|nr:hypothetical protein [Demequina pelophila]